MKLTLILLLFLWDNVEFTFTQEGCSQFPTVEHAFVSDEYRKAQYQKGDVIYFSCDPGYTTGLNTTYICTEDGWAEMTIGPCFVPDGDSSPVRLSCAQPPALKNGRVLQEAKIYVYLDGNRVIYQCDDLYVLRGGHHKTCSNGQWTGDLQCVATFCEKPMIDNGRVHTDQEKFAQNEVLSFSCDPGYIKVEPSVCLQVGSAAAQWSPSPQCEPLTCKLSSIPPEETRYNPQNQIIFRVGQTVNVSCGEQHWVKSTELQSAELTCLDRGDWDFQPLCRPVTCSKYDERVYRWQWTNLNTVRMDETLFYQCRTNYVQTSPGATCTRRGWEPNPLCEEILCAKPPPQRFTVEGEKTVYRNNEVLTYSCDPGYRKVDQTQPRCQKEGHSSQWIPAPYCDAITCKLSSNPPEETTYNPQDQTIFRPGQTVTVSCGEKHWVKSTELQSAELTCQDDGEWDFEPVCQLVTCFNHAEHVLYLGSSWRTFSLDETVPYRCDPNYVETSPRATCTRRGWQQKPLCKEILCPKPPPQSFTVEGDKTVYRINEVLTYSCDPGYRKVEQTQPQCQRAGHSSQWIPAPYCDAITCKLNSNPPEETTYNPQNQIIFRVGQTVNVSCGEKHWVKNKEHQSAELTCQVTGDWDFQPLCKPVTCSKYDERIKHVYRWQRTWLITVDMDETVTYQCQRNYVQRSPRATCTRRGWEPNPLCEDSSQ